jgi:hypothetical protein
MVVNAAVSPPAMVVMVVNTSSRCAWGVSDTSTCLLQHSYSHVSDCLHCCLAGAAAAVQVNDIGTVIPRNSVIEANQSGLIAEPLVDITPQLPLPEYT